MPWEIPERMMFLILTPPLLGPLNLVNTKLQDQKVLETPPPPYNHATRTQWVSEESLWIIDKRAALCHQLEHKQNVARTLTMYVQKSLTADS